MGHKWWKAFTHARNLGKIEDLYGLLALFLHYVIIHLIFPNHLVLIRLWDNVEIGMVTRTEKIEYRLFGF